MNRKTAISRASEQLINNRDATAMLNRTGFVRVMPKPDVPAYSHGLEPAKSLCYIVTFSTEEHAVLGRRLMAEFQGVKEFVA
jgi:hypothetical protein